MSKATVKLVLETESITKVTCAAQDCQFNLDKYCNLKSICINNRGFCVSYTPPQGVLDNQKT